MEGRNFHLDQPYEDAHVMAIMIQDVSTAKSPSIGEPIMFQ